MSWVSEQRLVDKINTICRNSWMTELDAELERNLAQNYSYKEEETVVTILGSYRKTFLGPLTFGL